MPLSVAVHKDIGEYQEKVVGKLSLRTLLCVAGGLATSVAAAAACQLLLGIGCVAGDEEKARIFQGNQPPFMVMGFDSHSIGYRKRLCFCENRCAGIPFFLGIIPILMISLQAQINLPFLELALLNTENIRIRFFKIF